MASVVSIENTIFHTIRFNAEFINVAIYRGPIFISLYIIDIGRNALLLRFGEIKTDTEDSAGSSWNHLTVILYVFKVILCKFSCKLTSILNVEYGAEGDGRLYNLHILLSFSHHIVGFCIPISIVSCGGGEVCCNFEFLEVGFTSRNRELSEGSSVSVSLIYLLINSCDVSQTIDNGAASEETILRVPCQYRVKFIAEIFLRNLPTILIVIPSYISVMICQVAYIFCNIGIRDERNCLAGDYIYIILLFMSSLKLPIRSLTIEVGLADPIFICYLIESAILTEIPFICPCCFWDIRLVISPHLFILGIYHTMSGDKLQIQKLILIGETGHLIYIQGAKVEIEHISFFASIYIPYNYIRILIRSRSSRRASDMSLECTSGVACSLIHTHHDIAIRSIFRDSYNNMVSFVILILLESMNPITMFNYLRLKIIQFPRSRIIVIIIRIHYIK